MRVRHRLLAGMTVAGLAGAVLVAAGAAGLLREALGERLLERIRAEAALVADTVQSLNGGDPHDLAVSLGRRLGARLTLIGADGTVLGDSACSRETLQLMDNHLDRPEVREAARGGTGESERLSDTTSVTHVYLARRVEGSGPVAFVRIALPASEIRRVHARYNWILALVVLGAMVVLTATGYAAVRRLSRPIERMADAVEGAARGEAELALPDDGAQEVARLGAAVTRLQRTLLGQLDELEAERALLGSVVSGMREGLLLVGSDRRVRLANPALLDAAEVSFDPRGRLLEEVIRHPTVLRDVETAFSAGQEIRQSVVRWTGSDRSFQLQVAPLRSLAAPAVVEAVLVLMFDITRQERLEAVRREFVANVSHELRTPLSSIKAFVETLREANVSQSDTVRFLGIIQKHADRMGDLIEDLTDLSLIETGAIALDLRQVDAAEVAAEVAEQFRARAAERRIDIRCELPSPFPIHADRRRLEQILTNLVDNAVKFNAPGGEIRIRGRRREKGTVLTVEDTGIGIPADSLEKVFHRFYQVSRDRSSETRGTGLGLAIVKHLMRLHGGRVQVESEVGQGSRFILEFPEAGAGCQGLDPADHPFDPGHPLRSQAV